MHLSKLFFSVASFFAILSIQTCSKKNIHSFNKGLTPITLETKSESSKECKSCHKEIYAEWEKTRHKVAFTNELYRESHAREPLIWCVNCHAPLMKLGGNPEKLEDRVFAEEGISCIVCHKRGEKILTSRIPTNPKEHSYLEVKDMKKSEFCENCHQFNFPVGTGNVPHKDFNFSNQPMQNTFTEWQLSFFYGKETCQDCHMKTKTDYKSHSFPGGHNEDYLRKTFSAKLNRISTNELSLVLSAKRLGHAFPTGDLFRTLVVRLLDKNNIELKKITLRYEYEEIEENRNSTTHSAKKLRSKNIITPPTAKETAYYIKNLMFKDGDIEKINSYELSMHYVNESNEFFLDSLDNSNTLIFKKEKINKINKDLFR